MTQKWLKVTLSSLGKLTPQAQNDSEVVLEWKSLSPAKSILIFFVNVHCNVTIESPWGHWCHEWAVIESVGCLADRNTKEERVLFEYSSWTRMDDS